MELLKKLIEICPKDGIVFDPFMESGSTGVACAKTGRVFIGIELGGNILKQKKERTATETAKLSIFAGEGAMKTTIFRRLAAAACRKRETIHARC